MNRNVKQKCKYALLVLSGLISLILPVAAVVAVRWETYTAHTVGGSLRLGVGGMAAVALCTLMLLDKMPKPRGIVLSAVLFGFCWLLQSLLSDLLLLTGMVLVGETVYVVFFQTALRRMRERERQTEAARAAAEQAEKIWRSHADKNGGGADRE